MSIAYRTKLETDNTTATRSPVINAPAGIADGDLLLMFLDTNATTTVAAGPIAGWTKVTDQNAGSDATTTLWWKIAASEGSSWSMTNIFSTTERCDAVVLAYTGTDQIAPIHKYASNTRTGTEINGPSITTTIDNCMIVLFAGTDPGVGSYTGTPDASPVATERHDAKNSGGSSYEYIYIEEYKQTTRGAIALDVTALTSDDYGHIQIAIREPAPTLTVADGYCPSWLKEPILIPVPLLTIADAYCVSFVEERTIQGSVTPADLYCVTQTDAVVVESSTEYAVVVQDAYCVSQADTIPNFSAMLYPIADTYDGNWLNELGNNTDLHHSLDEIDAVDTDYIQSDWNPSLSPVVIKLSSGTDPLVSTGHILRYRLEKYPVIGLNIKCVVQLRQDYVDETSMGTLIAEWIDSDLSDTMATIERTLTAGEVDNITDYTNIFVRITAGMLTLDVDSMHVSTTVETMSVETQTYYVDGTLGLNTNAGSYITAPWQTISYGVTQLKAGDKLYVRAGTYSEAVTMTTSGTAGNPITVESYPGETVVITGQTRNIISNSTSYITFDGIEVSYATEYGFWIQFPSEYWTIKNCNIHHCSIGILPYESKNHTIENCNIYSNTQHGIMPRSATVGRKTSGFTVRNNTVYDNLRYGIVWGNLFEGDYDAVGTKIYGNECYNNSTGIYLIFANNTEVYNNNLHDNGYVGCAGEPYGFAIESGSNNDIHDNLITDSYNTGIGVFGSKLATDGLSSGNSIHHNIISGTISGSWQRDLDWQTYNDDYVGINNKVYENIIFGSGWNVVIGDDDISGTGNLFYNNTIYGGAYGIYCEGDKASLGWTFTNNIFSANTTYSIFAGAITGGLTLANNIYYKSVGGTLVRYNSTDYTSANIATLDVNAILTNPLFVGTTTWRGFRLQNGSPAINAGVDLGSPYNLAFDPDATTFPPATTIDQDSYGAGWERGAFVYKV